MSKYKLGDKFIGEILDAFENNYGQIMYRFGNGKTNFLVEEYELDELQQYHEPTPEEHAQALKEHTIHEFSSGCVDCVLANNCDGHMICPRLWDLSRRKESDNE